MEDPDFLSVIDELLGVMDELREQIVQMQSMLEDKDGSIQSAIDNSVKVEQELRMFLSQFHQ